MSDFRTSQDGSLYNLLNAHWQKSIKKQGHGEVINEQEVKKTFGISHRVKPGFLFKKT